MYESKFFKDNEFRCRCCGLYLRNSELLRVLDDVREHFGVPVVVNSGTRCKDYNKRVGGAVGSKHLLGEAADITVKGVQPIEVWKYLTEKYPDTLGIGKYSTFTHVDTRHGKARWG